MSDYRVKLDVYNGPMDLLLYLIRRDELDIQDIPIARITEQYIAYVETLHQIDPDLAGEFLVMAATLMEIKTRLLLPVGEEAEEGEEGFDPRAELVRQLLEYKAFKDAAQDLRAAAVEQSMRFPRRPAEETAGTGKDLEEVQIWDLVEAFNRIMVAVGKANRQTEIIYDDTPIELHVADILDRLAHDGNMTFRDVFAGRTARSELIGLFLAVLELVRRKRILIEQSQPFGEIYIFINPNPPQAGMEQAAEQGLPQTAQDDRSERLAVAGTATGVGDPQIGEHDRSERLAVAGTATGVGDPQIGEHDRPQTARDDHATPRRSFSRRRNGDGCASPNADPQAPDSEPVPRTNSSQAPGEQESSDDDGPRDETGAVGA